VIAAAAFTLPPIVRGLSRGSPGPVGTGGHGTPWPTAGRLTHFRWSSLPPSPLGPRSRPLLAWTGRELLELGGTSTSNNDTARSGDAAAYDPATGHWRSIAHVPNTVGLSGGVTVWTGRQLFVTNGRVSSKFWNAVAGAPAALYDPAANRWSVTDLPVRLLGADQLAAAWTGRSVVVAGVVRRRLQAASYDPATNRWRVISPTLPAAHPPVGLAMVATSSRLLLWSLWSKTTKTSATSYAVASGVDVLALGPAGWTDVTGNWPQHKTVDDPVCGNGTILLAPSQIWCGMCSHPGGEFPARLADADSLALYPVPKGPLVTRYFLEPPIWLWNGRAVLAANTTGSRGDTISQLGAYDPRSGHWHLLPVPPRAPVAANPLWAGREVLLLTAAGKLLSFHR